MAAVVVVALVPTIALALAPDPPTGLTAVAGADAPVVATLSWGVSADEDLVGYRVYVATQSEGPYHLQTLVASIEYVYTDGLGGVPYYFRVTTVTQSGESAFAQTGPVTAPWYSSPHGASAVDSMQCDRCHATHSAYGSLLLRSDAETETAAQTATCYACHDGRAPSVGNIKDGSEDSFDLRSGHSIDTSPAGAGLTRGCSSCHEIHGDADASPMLPREQINGVQVESTGPAWCYACHNEADSWFGPGYPPPSSPSRDASGYPVAGTWPGEPTYSGTTNAHRLIPETTQTVGSGNSTLREEGDCLYCHASHRGANKYDALLATFRPTTASTLASDQADGLYAALCLKCHGGVTPSGFTTAPIDIEQFVTSSDPDSGHRIVTAGGSLPVGAPLPCYECHNPHGSERANQKMLSDGLGGGLATDNPTGVRAFCFTCHTASDTARGWDSETSQYVDVGASEVVGLQRIGGALRLRAINGHAETDTAFSCYSCHGDDYGAWGKNVHNPGTDFDVVQQAELHTAGAGQALASLNGEACSGCHLMDVIEEHENFACADCHERPDAMGVIAAGWPERDTDGACAACHGQGTIPVAHTTDPVPAHTSSVVQAPVPNDGGLACNTCHDLNLTVEHGQAGVSCVQCHTASYYPAGLWDQTCTACHISGQAPVPHEDVVSSHVATTTQGCLAGPGCHDVDLQATHSGVGCSASGCHDSVERDMSVAYRSCGQDGGCHASYNVTTHGTAASTDLTHTTGAAMTTEVTWGGASAMCGECHSSELGTAHTDTSVGTISCVACHTQTTPIDVVDIVTVTGWSPRTCAKCHDSVANGGVGPGFHTAYDTGHNATSPEDCGDGVCHESDVRSVHQAIGCLIAGCHDAADKDMTAAQRSCGSGGDCHATVTRATHP